MNLSLRARLTVWYGFVLLAVLAGGGAAVAELHARLSLGRIDAALADYASLVAGRIRAELDEEGDLPEAAAEAVEELELRGTGVAVLSSAGAVLAVRETGGESADPAALFDAGAAAGVISRGGARFHLQTVPPGDSSRVVVWTSLAAHDQERATVRRALWLGVPLALLAASLGGWIVGRHGLRPLEDMTRQVQQMTGDRPEARLTPPARRDELGVLAAAFNGLLDRLASTLRVQRQFMADASHQIRTPVSIVRTAAEVALSGPRRAEDEYREALAVIAAQSRRLTQMIDGMLTLTLADLDARPLQIADFYLDEVVEECVRAAQALAAPRQVGVRGETPGEVRFRGDEGLLRQLLMNLAENAVRHTPPGGTVSLAVSVDEGSVVLSVADTGPGIPEADRERIFSRFVRLDSAESAGGAGLGLPIARWVAEAHGGTLRLESSGPGGSRFVARLPAPSDPID